MSEETPFAQWCVMEMMGHRRLAGFVTEEEIGGASLLRIDVPGDSNEPVATQYYSPSALYCLTPTTEEIARKVAASNRPQPVTRWELEPARTVPAEDDDCYHDEDGAS